MVTPKRMVSSFILWPTLAAGFAFAQNPLNAALIDAAARGDDTALQHEIFVTNDYPGGYWENQGYNWFGGS